MNETYKALITSLHTARLQSMEAENNLKAAKKSFEEEIAPIKNRAKALSEIAEKLKVDISNYALAAGEKGVLDADGPVTLKNATDVVIDQAKALEWAKVNMPVAVITMVNETLLAPFVKDHPEWATVTTYKKPNVAADLTKYVK